MNKLLTFAFIGGDKRQLCAASQIADAGYHVRVFGLDKGEMSFKGKVSKSAAECVSGADVIVLPMPYTTDKSTVNAPLSNTSILLSEVTDSADKDAVIFAGKVDCVFEEMCRESGVKVVDYAAREELSVMNATPTAEGAIQVAMTNTPYTLRGSRCLVIGYGKIGKVLSAALKALGADVTASARKYSDLAWIKTNGLNGIQTSAIAEVADRFDIIFNTVASLILNFKVLSKTKPDVLIIDLASRPGGVDFDTADDLNRKVIWALSLPGKVAPRTAGEIIKDTLMNILEELGV